MQQKFQLCLQWRPWPEVISDLATPTKEKPSKRQLLLFLHDEDIQAIESWDCTGISLLHAHACGLHCRQRRSDVSLKYRAAQTIHVWDSARLRACCVHDWYGECYHI